MSASTALPTSSAEADDRVVLGDRGGTILAVPLGKPLQRVAVAWRYLGRRRGRWRGADAAALAVQARDDLAGIAGALDEEQLERLAAAPVVEVAVPFSREERGWEARILPWELLLGAIAAAATADRPPPLVVRRLAVATRSPSPALRGTGRRIVSAIGGSPAGGEDLGGTFDAIGKRLASERPAVVEVRGYHAVEAASRLGLETRRDGLVFPAAGGGVEVIEAERAARGLAAGGPRLVLFRLGSSAARLAALTVGYGAAAAVAFHEAVDGAAMETFYAVLDDKLRAGEGLLAAFAAAVGRAGAELDGRAVLWSRDTLLIAAPPFLAAGDSVREHGAELLDGGGARTRELLAPAVVDGRWHDAVTLVVEPQPTLNYGLLHNRRPLFVDFYLRVPRPEPEVAVAFDAEVSLHLGGEPIAWRETVALPAGDEVLSLRDRVVLPLTWVLGRRLPESVKTTLAVTVRGRRGGAAGELRRQVFPVEILPFDEWRDDDENRGWLPSFVLPRDPAVAEIVARADGHLAALADHAHAGFDGYQCQAPGADDPWAGVDLQVRALWTVLMHDLGLRYINPPPTYRHLSQRLRSPGEVVAAGRGTCIDLALLVAACLEYVGIDPVLFLVRGHAFAGYWRQEGDATRRLVEVARSVAEQRLVDAGEDAGDGAGDTEDAADAREAHAALPWGLGAGTWSAVVDLVQRRELVALETVELTAGGGFARAAAEGFVNLRNRADFQLLLDVAAARREGVTPLPLSLGEAGER